MVKQTPFSLNYRMRNREVRKYENCNVYGVFANIFKEFRHMALSPKTDIEH